MRRQFAPCAAPTTQMNPSAHSDIPFSQESPCCPVPGRTQRMCKTCWSQPVPNGCSSCGLHAKPSPHGLPVSNTSHSSTGSGGGMSGQPGSTNGGSPVPPVPALPPLPPASPALPPAPLPALPAIADEPPAPAPAPATFWSGSVTTDRPLQPMPINATSPVKGATRRMRTNRFPDHMAKSYSGRVSSPPTRLGD
jgi:hypothetical protein